MKSGQAINLEFKFIEFDVKAHEAELFDMHQVKVVFLLNTPSEKALCSALAGYCDYTPPLPLPPPSSYRLAFARAGAESKSETMTREEAEEAHDEKA